MRQYSAALYGPSLPLADSGGRSVDRAWIRNAAIAYAFACGTLVAGPGLVGIAQAHAILGIGPDLLDLFGDDDKSDIHHPRPGSEDSSSGQAARTVGVTTADAGPPVSTFGSGPESAGLVAGGGAVPRSAARGGGGGAVPRVTSAGRSSNLPSVPSAPITRNIVIRGTSSTARPAGTPAPAFVPPALPKTPAFVPLAAPPPVAPEPEGRPAPAAPPAPSQSAPQAKDPLAPSDSGAARIPDSYRVGYTEHLRSATTTDLFAAALPGVAGIAGFTLVGAYAGYRQAKTLQRALLAPVPTSFLL
jgi:hypothetical protein